jgi:hypothetical protein
MPMYHFEHFMAWLFALGALALGAIGLLRGFGYIGNDVPAGTDDLAAKWDALLWIIPALSAALLSFAFHATDHHLARDPSTLSPEHEGMWKGEHFFAWVMALGAIGLTLVGMFAGFNTFSDTNEYSQFDGLLWVLCGFGAAVLTNTLHFVRHHQMASDHDYIVTLVERRVRSRSEGAVPTATYTTLERK